MVRLMGVDMRASLLCTWGNNESGKCLMCMLERAVLKSPEHELLEDCCFFHNGFVTVYVNFLKAIKVELLIS